MVIEYGIRLDCKYCKESFATVVDILDEIDGITEYVDAILAFGDSLGGTTEDMLFVCATCSKGR